MESLTVCWSRQRYDVAEWRRASQFCAVITHYITHTEVGVTAFGLPPPDPADHFRSKRGVLACILTEAC